MRRRICARYLNYCQSRAPSRTKVWYVQVLFCCCCIAGTLPPRETHTKILICAQSWLALDLHNASGSPGKTLCGSINSLRRSVVSAEENKAQLFYFQILSYGAIKPRNSSSEWHFWRRCLYLWLHKSGDLLGRHVLGESKRPNAWVREVRNAFACRKTETRLWVPPKQREIYSRRRRRTASHASLIFFIFYAAAGAFFTRAFFIYLCVPVINLNSCR